MPKPPPVLVIPPKMDGVDHWLILGLDPSLTCTGYALMHVTVDSPEKTVADWLEVGSVRPDSSKDPVWVRSRLMAGYLKTRLDEQSHEIMTTMPDNLGLMITMEAPTPSDDFLNRANAVFQEHFFTDGDLFRRFKIIRLLTINAMTLRSIMGLHTKGNNKGENIRRALEFLPQGKFDNLDGDACDGVMLSMVARAACSVLLGNSSEVNPKWLQTLCDSSPVERGKGRNARITTKGLFHTTGQRPEYWYSYDRKEYTCVVRNASQPKKTLNRFNFPV